MEGIFKRDGVGGEDGVQGEVSEINKSDEMK
jgi:hypothetical protein